MPNNGQIRVGLTDSNVNGVIEWKELKKDGDAQTWSNKNNNPLASMKYNMTDHKLELSRKTTTDDIDSQNEPIMEIDKSGKVRFLKEVKFDLGSTEIKSVNGHLTGDIRHDGASNSDGIVLFNGTSTSDAWFKGDVKNSSGTVVLDVSQPLLTGDVTGNLTGDVKNSSGTVVLDVSQQLLTGDVTGDLTGDVKNSSGTVVLDVSQPLLTSNVTGDVDGNLATDEIMLKDTSASIKYSDSNSNVNKIIGFGDDKGFSVKCPIFYGNIKGVFNTDGSNNPSEITGNVTGNVTGNLLGNASTTTICNISVSNLARLDADQTFTGQVLFQQTISAPNGFESSTHTFPATVEGGVVGQGGAETLVASTVGSFDSESDIRLKENISDIVNSISVIKQIKPKNYSFKKDPYKTMKMGVIAQDLLKVLPNLVKTYGENNHYCVDYTSMIGLLIAGMQEQQTQIDRLKQELEDLKNN